MVASKFEDIRPKLIEFIREQETVTPTRVRDHFGINYNTAEKYLQALKGDGLLTCKIVGTEKKRFKLWELV